MTSSGDSDPDNALALHGGRRDAPNRRRISNEDLTALALIALSALLVFASQWISPNLGSWSTVRAILVLSTFLIVVGFGQQTVILTGGLDLSVASMMTLGAILMFSFVGGSPAALAWGLPLVLLVTGGLGAVSGIGIALLRIPPFIMTLAMGIILAGALLGITGGSPRGTASAPLVYLFAGSWFGVPPVVYAMGVLVLVASLLQRRSAFGRMVYAIGTSVGAAYIAGLPVKRVTVLCYAISGASAGLAGVLMVGFSQGATLTSGDDVMIPSIAAVVIGGTAIVGGRGVFLGVVGGALFLTTLSTMIAALGLAAGWRSIIYGTVILLALLALQQDLRLLGTRLRSAFGSALLKSGKTFSTPTGGTLK